MANEYAVNRADLVSVADAIRQKGETQEALTFPADFVAAIGAIDVGKNGATLVVTCPAGVTVTVSRDGTVYTKTADGEGIAEFIGITTGTWTVTITDGSQTAQKTVTIQADYETSIAFFSALIHITYPSGLVCTATDGVTTLRAPDTSGSWACVVPNAGTWTASLDSGLRESVTITEDGQTTAIEHWYLYDNGDERTDITGGWTAIGMPMNSASHHGSKAPTVAKGSGSVTMSIEYDPNNAKYLSGAYYIKRKIDLTNISTLSAVVGNVSHYEDTYVLLAVLSAIGTYFDDNKIATKGIATGSEKKTVELDVSGISGEQYICLYLMANPYVSSTITLYAMEAR